MDETKNKKMFFRMSKKGGHLYGFVPEGGIKEGYMVLIPLKTKVHEDQKYAGIISVVKGKAEFVGASIVPKDEKEDNTEIK